MIWTGRWCFWRRSRADMLRGKRCSWTAGFRPELCGLCGKPKKDFSVKRKARSCQRGTETQKSAGKRQERITDLGDKMNPFRRFMLPAAMFVFGSASLLPAASAAPAEKSLRAYFVDVEGGQATLFVTPEGESLLIDTGWPGNSGRDADRIVAAAKDAGVSKIDYVLITHYHDDHVGGAPQLAAKIPIGTFVDHGVNRETDGNSPKLYDAYKALLDSGK